MPNSYLALLLYTFPTIRKRTYLGEKILTFLELNYIIVD